MSAKQAESAVTHAEPRGVRSGISEKGHAEPRSTQRGDKAASAPSSALSASPRANLSGWQTVKLASVLSEQPRNGWSPPAKFQTNTGVPVLTLSSVTGFEYDGTKAKLSSAPTHETAHDWLRRGELLITRSNTQDLVGHAAIFDGFPEQVICCDLIMKMRVDPQRADTRFIHFYLQSPEARTYLTGRAQGASSTMKKIGKSVVQDLPIPLPSLAEQRRIVGILDEALARIAVAKARAEQNRQHARALFESHLHAVFSHPGPGWVEKQLQDVLLEQPRNGWSPPAVNHSDSGTPVLTLSAVTGFEFRADKRKFTTARVEPKRHYWVTNGDFLITRSNTPALVGHVAIAEGLSEPTIYPDLIMRMRPNGAHADTRFLWYQLRTPALREVITGRAEGANPTMKKIGKEDVQTLPIRIPPLAEQKRIVHQLDALSAETRRLEGLYERKAAALDELKQSLLHQAFSGQL